MSIAYGAIKSSSLGHTNTGTAAVSNTSVADVAVTDPVIEIHVSATNLVKMDIGSDSDPMVVLFIPVNGKYVEVDRTEVIWDNPNPQWVKTFKSLYIFETSQPLRFCVYDCDSEKGPLSNHDFVGYCDTDVQTLVTHNSSDVKLELRHDSLRGPRGTLVLTAEQTQSCSTHVNFVAAISDIKKLRLFSRNNPYIVIYKPSEAGRFLPVFRSEVVPKCTACTFKPFSIPLQSLCNGDMLTPVQITVFDYREGKVDVPVGSMTMSLQSLMENQSTKFPINDPKKKGMGFIRFNRIELIQKPTFLDYLRSGLQLNLITAIDFTASNRDPRDPNSLHFLNPSYPNQYESCIWSIGGVVCPYDTDQLFPVFGFGGKINGVLSHCFPLTLDNTNPNVQGLQGIVASYRNSLSLIQLSGPTCFMPIIRSATQVSIASFQESHTYSILLIITDGVINDMTETIDAIVDATNAPLSIIIVGVGNADFSLMDQLDADDAPLKSSSGVIMKRDIVQFVPYNQFSSSSPQALAAAVLEEVPRQVDEFCKTHGFIPQMQ